MVPNVKCLYEGSNKEIIPKVSRIDVVKSATSAVFEYTAFMGYDR